VTSHSNTAAKKKDHGPALGEVRINFAGLDGMIDSNFISDCFFSWTGDSEIRAQVQPVFTQQKEAASREPEPLAAWIHRSDEFHDDA
jgi:hypothetical protein